MISLADYKNVEDYTKAIKKLSNQLAKLGVTIPEPLVILRYLQGLGSAYSASFTTNNQILPDKDDEPGITFDFVALKTKGYEKTLVQEDASTALVAKTVLSRYLGSIDISAASIISARRKSKDSTHNFSIDTVGFQSLDNTARISLSTMKVLKDSKK
jgi:hypothetical protein